MSKPKSGFLTTLKIALIAATYIVALGASFIGACVLFGAGHYIMGTLAAWAFLVIIFIALAMCDDD